MISRENKEDTWLVVGCKEVIDEVHKEETGDPAKTKKVFPEIRNTFLA
ncbi:MAG TPA: hypothetical protein GXZ20_09215 [Halanaerobiaceae bacterium]|nr:hypothetical protein [Halanaerobiaceae bacterium]